LDAAGKRSEGKPFIAYPLSVSRMSIAAVVIFFGVVLLSCLMPVRDRRHVFGYTEPKAGVVQVYAERGGVIVGKLPQVGDSVLKGQGIVTVQAQPQSRIDGAASSRGSVATEEKLKSLQNSADEAAVELRARMSRLRIVLEQSQAELAGVVTKMDVAKRLIQVKDDRLGRANRLSVTDYVSKDFVADREAELLEAKLRWSELNQQMQRLKLAIRENEARLGQELASQREEQRQLDRLILDQIGATADRTDIISFSVEAPVPGRISTVAFQSGQFVDSTRALMSIMPDDGGMWCVLLVEPRELAFLERGQRVSLRYSAFPYQFFGTFPGVIRRLDSLPVGDVAAGKEPRYRVFVEPVHQSIDTVSGSKDIVPGMQVEAVVWLDERSLASWIFRPLTQVISMKPNHDG